MSSRFEFVGRTAVGQYYPIKSWFHLRDPRARLISIVMLFIGTLFSPTPWGLGLGMILGLLIFRLAKLSIKPALKGIARALPFILILAVLQIIFGSPKPNELLLYQVIGIQITHTLLISALMLIARFLVLIILINALVMSISTAQITAALFHLLKPLENIRFPVNDLTMIVQITLRYLPLVALSAEKIAKAQASRGGDWEQRGFNPIRQATRILPLIVPIIVNSLRQAETMAVAMESRGFNAANKRSSYYDLEFNLSDGILIIISITFSALMVLSGHIF